MGHGEFKNFNASDTLIRVIFKKTFGHICLMRSYPVTADLIYLFTSPFRRW